ncbi:UbiA prenyltransferase family protein [hydrothermal vent metagenome]|uniref:UbiA prenyltransferase family protein n=1 Tax=hydrothermal vent metagenome TaxID=652676 RepID=A0A1W1CE81_9ZZZZ
MQLSHIIKLMRPHQYVKNSFIFLPLFFALKITDLELLTYSFIAFIAFSLSASAIYILNDYFDIEEDRQHPKKRYRPLASGDINKKQAITLIIFLLGTGVSIMSQLSISATIILLAYLSLNIIYTLSIKHIAILDITTIAIGFVLRLFVGSAVTGIYLSMWIVIMTFLLALFMALAKRRDDILIYLNTGKKMRKVIDGYNLKFIDGAMMIMASIVIVSYILYTTSKDVINRVDNGEYLYLTTLFVLLGIMRYMQITFVFENSGSPSEIILKDRFIQSTILCWILSFIWILY